NGRARSDDEGIALDEETSGRVEQRGKGHRPQRGVGDEDELPAGDELIADGSDEEAVEDRRGATKVRVVVREHTAGQQIDSSRQRFTRDLMLYRIHPSPVRNEDDEARRQGRVFDDEWFPPLGRPAFAPMRFSKFFE